MDKRIKNIFRFFGVIIVSVTVVVAIVSIVEAGSLQPSSAPSASSDPTDLNDIYNAVVSGFDSSSLASKSNGSAIQIGRCILEKMRGNDDGC